MADFNHVYGAGLQHASVRDDDGVVYDIDAIINAEGDPTQEDTEIKGDDTIKATFSSGRKEELTITANAISMDVLQAITGNTVSSSAGGSTIAVGTVAEMSAPFVEITMDVTARSDAGTAVIVRKVWHKVQLNKAKVTAGNGSELAVELTGIAIQTSTNIVGGALTTARVATLAVVKVV